MSGRNSWPTRAIWTADACWRRSLESLFDIGRHILAKAYGVGAGEYKEVATQLGEHGVLTAEEAEMLRVLAGYRNRLVHFYHEVSADELFDVCAYQLEDIELIADGYRRWIQGNPQLIDNAI